ncbi:hypothetical protein L7F22_005646 [Adiantum nelumboides]|nr:hypothetical protein [Adiantum nelumboides]
MLQLRRLIKNFRFGGLDGSSDTRARVRWFTCILPTSQGGLGIIDPEMQSCALLTNEPWKMLLQSALATVTPTQAEYAAESALHKTIEVSQQTFRVADGRQADLVIGADTVVELDGFILEKPKDEDDAVGMLSNLSGKDSLDDMSRSRLS